MVCRNLDRQRENNNRESETPNLSHDLLQHDRNDSRHVEDDHPNNCKSEDFVASRAECEFVKRKRTSKLASRVAMGLQVTEAANLPLRDENMNHNEEEQQGNINGGSTHLDVNRSISDTRAASKTTGRGHRGKYKSFVVDMKTKGKGSKLTIEIPDEIDRAIGANARYLVNECGRIVRTKAPIDVKNWQEVLCVAGESMWREIKDKFQIVESSDYLKMYTFVVDTMQRLYRLWKCRLHYYYKSPKFGKTDVERLNNPPPDLPKKHVSFGMIQINNKVAECVCCSPIGSVVCVLFSYWYDSDQQCSRVM